LASLLCAAHFLCCDEPACAGIIHLSSNQGCQTCQLSYPIFLLKIFLVYHANFFKIRDGNPGSHPLKLLTSTVFLFVTKLLARFVTVLCWPLLLDNVLPLLLALCGPLLFRLLTDKSLD
jgi:hypothetical protein